MFVGLQAGDEHRSELPFVLVWALISAWLLACALLVGGEYGDGYQTIANARYFFGDNPDIYVQRGPLAALALWPVELITTALDLGPLDVRPYHLYSAVLHSAYLLGCWLLLKRSGGTFFARIIAFIAAILSVVFYAFAPFLNHDIIPGFLFLLFIFLSDLWLKESKVGTALLLVLLGTAVVLIKQTFAIFWVSVCVYTTLAWLLKWHAGKVSLSRLLSLFAMAGLSAILSWVGYGWFLGADIPSVALLKRPLLLISKVSTQYQGGTDLAALFPWDLYLRNLQNYGVATILMLVPGVWLAFRDGDDRRRMIAIGWVFSVLILQLTAFREVRYLAFLAPLAAVLIVPVIDALLKSRAWVLPLVAVLLIDQFRGVATGAALLISSADMNVTRFVGESPKRGKLFSSDQLSFVYQAESPLRRDRYHGIFHLTVDQLFRLNAGTLEISRVIDPRDLGQLGMQPGDRVLFSNRTVVRQPPWQDDNSPYKVDELLMASGDAKLVELKRRGDHFSIDDYENRYVMLIPAAEMGKTMPLIAMGKLSTASLDLAYGRIEGNSIRVLVVVLDAMCQADRCTYFK